MEIKYCSSPCGSGKTFAANEDVERRVKAGEKVLILQMTTNMIDRTAAALRARGVPCVPYYGAVATSNNTITREISNRLKEPEDRGLAVIITHSAFDLLPFFMKPHRQNWHVVVDEVLPAYKKFSFDRIGSIHTFLTDHFRVEPRDQRYGLLLPNKSGLRSLIRKGRDDKALNEFCDIAYRLLKGWNGYVDIAKFQDLRAGRAKELTIFGLLDPSVMRDFASVTMVGACFEQTPLFLLWQMQGVRFVRDAAMEASLRYHQHPGGERVTIHYGYERDWSKTFRDKADAEPLRRYEQGVRSLVANEPLLFLANDDIGDKVLSDLSTARRLPNSPHGLNDFQNDYCNFASFSALRLTPDLSDFLQASGLSPDELVTSSQCYQVYQGALRSSVRNPEDLREKMLIVPDKRTATFLEKMIPGSSLVDMGLGRDESWAKPKIGRPRKYENDNARKIAFRQRKREAKDLALAEKIASMKAGSSTDWCDETPYNIDSNTSSKKQNTDTRLLGTVWEQLNATESISLFGTIKSLVDELRRRSKCVLVSKNENALISPSEFARLDGVDGFRTEANIVRTVGIFLDFDGGAFQPKHFGRLMSEVQFVAYATYSSTKSAMRWRAWIPTSREMTPCEYRVVARALVDEIERRRNFKWNAVVPHHGIDVGKLSPTNLFYLPCVPKERSGSYFAWMNRTANALDVDHWSSGTVEQSKLFKEDVKGDNDNANGKNADRIAGSRAISRYYAIGVLPGHGDQELFSLNKSLLDAGYSRDEISEILLDAARASNTPADRLRQRKSLVRVSK